MYHNPLGPPAATGLGAGAGLFAFTPMGVLWVLLAAFAVAGAVGALMRILPASLTEVPRAALRRPQPTQR
ncbi:hypothetical protein PZ938_02195 [Luteipulveratus sp. YIM 133132]|uniref:Uncharacterized protein n=1 Tax=Luteipulveratus flavus TaxID=3031728 RepID=A0ABT6C6I7_9MICO|nr:MULTISPECIES: hypothetical protein [unclassified Luteipulveratus]MDE9364404.1 hypothetical protein [Luteipulveratus sp. YIM 133132]MDF8263957.1 hypothetical protein [Luteipulveratus sp. YIM 133296]